MSLQSPPGHRLEQLLRDTHENSTRSAPPPSDNTTSCGSGLETRPHLPTLKWCHCESLMGLKVGELKLKINRDVGCKRKSPGVRFANGSEGERDIVRKFREVHNRVGMDGNHEVIFALEGRGGQEIGIIQILYASKNCYARLLLCMFRDLVMS